MHGLLLLVVVGSSAFQGQPPKPDVPIVNIIPSKILDAAEAGGGTPRAAVTPTPAPAAQPAAQPQPKAIEQPQPEPVKPKPEVVKTEPIPDPPKRHVKHHDPEPDLSDFQPIESAHPKVLIPKKTKRMRSPDEINVDISHTTSTKSSRKQLQAERARQEAREAAEEQAAEMAYNNSVKRALGKIGSEVTRGIGDKTSGLTVIGKVGQGGGGESYAGYEQVLGGIFYRAWVPPEGASDSSSDTEVEIVVARNGSVISARITSGSTRSMDRSVQAALNKVRKLPPFPEGANDSQRTFQIVFNLKAKLSAG